MPSRDLLDGDTVELVRVNGQRSTFRAPFGRLYMTTDELRMLLDNYRLLKTHI